MRLELDLGQTIHVFLSQRNLLALLAKLEGLPADSERTIALDTEAGKLLVTAEPDHQHYGDRPPPGPMHPATEEAIAREVAQDNRETA